MDLNWRGRARPPLFFPQHAGFRRARPARQLLRVAEQVGDLRAFLIDEFLHTDFDGLKLRAGTFLNCFIGKD